MDFPQAHESCVSESEDQPVDYQRICKQAQLAEQLGIEVHGILGCILSGRPAIHGFGSAGICR